MTDAPSPVLKRMQSPAYRSWVLGLFMLITLFAFADRQIITALGQAIKHDLGLSDGQLGLLAGLAFALFNTVLTIPIARWADRGRRLTLITAGVFLWSIATALCGLARGFGQLVLARALVGMGEATGGPATSSVIADYFPRDRRASAMAFFALAIPLGALVGGAGGGWIAQHFDWRMAFFIAGAPGVVLGLLLAATIREPLRGHYDPPTTGDTPSLMAVLRRMIERPSFLHTMLGSTIVSVAGFGIISFHAPYFFRRFGLDYAQAGLLAGLISAVPGSLCMVGAGLLADRLGRRDPRFYGWVPAIGALLATPGYILAFLQPGWIAATTVLMLTGLFQYAYLPVSNGIYQNVMEPRMRASASAVVGIATNLVSAGFGPLLVGTLSDWLTHRSFAAAGGGDYSAVCVGARAAQTAAAGACGQASMAGLQWACILTAGLYLWGAVHFVLAARTVKRDMA